MKRVTVLTMILLACSVVGVYAKHVITTASTVIASHTTHPVSGMATLTSSSGKVKHNNGLHLGELAELLGLTVSAQSAEVPSLQPQSFEGFCATIPPGLRQIVYGLGRLSNSDCVQDQQDASDGGVYVDEDGTIGNLVVVVDGQGADANDGVTELWVNRAGQPRFQLATVCVQNLQVVCKNNNRSPVLNGDRVYARFLGAGSLRNIQITFTKQ